MKKFYKLLLSLSLFLPNLNATECLYKSIVGASSQYGHPFTPLNSTVNPKLSHQAPSSFIENDMIKRTLDDQELGKFCAFFENHPALQSLLYFATTAESINWLSKLIAEDDPERLYYYEQMINRSRYK